MVTKHSWLVGLGFRTLCGRLVRHYYVVYDMTDPERAFEAALERAHSPRERAVRGNLRLDDEYVEIRRVLRDPLGILQLSVPSPVPRESAAVV